MWCVGHDPCPPDVRQMGRHAVAGGICRWGGGDRYIWIWGNLRAPRRRPRRQNPAKDAGAAVRSLGFGRIEPACGYAVWPRFCGMLPHAPAARRAPAPTKIRRPAKANAHAAKRPPRRGAGRAERYASPEPAETGKAQCKGARANPPSAGAPKALRAGADAPVRTRAGRVGPRLGIGNMRGGTGLAKSRIQTAAPTMRHFGRDRSRLRRPGG